jgi:hypothetical protein
MRKLIFLLLASMTVGITAIAQTLDERIPVRGLAVAAPTPQDVKPFIRFIEEELVPAKLNLLILRVDWGYAYESHPELRDRNPLSRADVDKLVAVCRKHGIRLVPHVNLLGHQSWAKETNALLRVYPEFDETPSVKTEDYTGWPNPQGLYCKSYCPLHPDVHKVVFDIVDEICDAFQTDAFHAGMDEVFYLGEKECPRCKGRDRAELYAGEVRTIHDHLALSGRQLMIWGDRLLDGRTTGLGEWEASYNETWRAIDMIPKDILICDWHYERADLSGVYFAMKGLPVVSCGYRNPETSVQQVKDMVKFRTQTNRETKKYLQGYVHTIWSGANAFLKAYYGKEEESARGGSDAKALKAVLSYMKELAKE